MRRAVVQAVRSTVGAVQAAQDAFARHSWHEVYTLLTDAGDGPRRRPARDARRGREPDRAGPGQHPCLGAGPRRPPACRSARPGGAERVLGGTHPAAARRDGAGGRVDDTRRAHRRGAGTRRAGRGPGDVADPRRPRCSPRWRRRDRARARRPDHHHRDRGGRARSAGLRSALRRPGGAGRRRHRAEHADVRRGDAQRHDGRRLADPGRDHLLRGGRRLRRGVRPTACGRVDRGAAALV